MTVVYVVGVPGAGKSTAVAAAINRLGWGVPEPRSKPFAHGWYPDPNAVVLGRQGAAFPGTDTLSLGVNPQAIEFVETSDVDTIVGEGDRLANNRFFVAAARSRGIIVVALAIPSAAAYHRMLDRADRLGVDPQKESWWNGRATKVGNLRRFRCPGLRHATVDADAPPGAVADAVADIIAESRISVTGRP
jgi:hypothetical protein